MVLVRHHPDSKVWIGVFFLLRAVGFVSRPAQWYCCNTAKPEKLHNP